MNTVATAELHAVARTYLLAIHNDSLMPARMVQQEHGLSRGQAAARLRAARELGLLPYAGRGLRVFGPGHWPRAAQWCTADGRPRTIWTACQECRQLWPCENAATLVWLAGLPNPEYL